MTRFWVDFSVVVIANLFIFVRCNGDRKYEFKMEHVTKVESKFRYPAPLEHEVIIQGGELPSNDDELKALCIAAKDYALLDVVSGVEDDIVAFKPRVMRLQLDRLDLLGTYQGEYLHVFGCNTLPKVWIYPGNSDGEFTILMDSSYFAEGYMFSYDVRTVQSLPVPCAEEDDPETEDVIKNSMFWDEELNPLEIFHLCWNSKRNVKPIKPVLREGKIRRHVLKFDFPTGPEKIYAYECLSTPAMYAYFVEPKPMIYDVNVIVFQPELPPSLPNGNDVGLVPKVTPERPTDLPPTL